MEWARCVDLRAEGIQVITSTGDELWQKTSTAYSRGAPTVTQARTRITISLSTARASDDAAKAYLNAFRLEAKAAATGGHQVFEAHVDGVRYLIPALVLMRALFIPSRYLLATMFRPHAMDLTCYADLDVPHSRLQMLAPWATEANARRFSPWESRLKWILSYESAFRMAGSVHEFAVDRIIGLTLPRATVSGNVEGVRTGNEFYATKCTLTSITPDESPLFNMGLGPTIFTSNDAYFSVPGRVLARITDVPAHSDGSVDLTDEEWKILRPVVLRQSASRYKHCPRLLLDGVLAKLASGKGWQKCEYKTGNWHNATFTHQTLRKSGALNEVLRILEGTRTNPHHI